MTTAIYVHRFQELLDMAKTARAKRLVRKKTKAKACLLCQCEANPRRRGLCDYHYHQFDNEKRKQPNRKKMEEFDREQVRVGMILESRRGRTPRHPNPFAATQPVG